MALHTAHLRPVRGARGADDRGATAVEYALLVALIATVIAVAVGTVGWRVVTIFTDYIASY
ncbi:MAG: Flp family type IVb pilin [Egibacteraceae bacterium]